MNGTPKSERARLAAMGETLRSRNRIFLALREFFRKEGFLEVSTPIRLEAPAPERNIDLQPSGDLFLAASPELQMKRLVGAGHERIFQISKCFRKGERGDRHLPEFTMLEWYRAGGTMRTLMDDCGSILEFAARALDRYPEFTFGNEELPIDLSQPWLELEVQDAFESIAGWRPGPEPDEYAFDVSLVEKVEPALPHDRPTFLMGYPRNMASLAKLDPEIDERALRVELYIGGLELSNGFEELLDPTEQRTRFEAEERIRRENGKPPLPLDEAFLEDLGLGVPPCAGMAMGLDRLVMLLTNSPSIEDVVPFS